LDSNLPLISVIVPVYNVETYLARCLDSIIAQSYRNLEIIVINDGSLDRCPFITEEYAKKDYRIRLVHQENAGLSESRNVGIRLSHGIYISFIDSDDFIDPDYYETLYRVLHSNNVDISICNKRIINFTVVRSFPVDVPEGVSLYSSSEALTELVNDKWLGNYVWDKLFKKELFYGIEFPKGRTFEDIAIMHKIFYRAKTVAITNEIKYNYVARKKSVTFVRSICNEYNCFLSHIERVSFFESVNLSDLALKEIIVAFQVAMRASILAMFHFTTPREKEYLRAIKTWAASYKDKLNILPYETASDANKIQRFFTSRTFFMVRYAPEVLYIRSNAFIKQLLPVKFIVLFIKVKSFIKNGVNLSFIII
jgi:glycosyltransferase involved in cell wall biosynthesis